MLTWSLAFCIGVVTLIFLPYLPPLYYAWVIVLSAPTGIFLRVLRIPITCGLGFAWALLFVHHQLAQSPSHNLSNQPTTIIGNIAALPETKANNTEFEFLIKQPYSMRVRLSWRKAPPTLQVGDTWQLTAHLKPARGFWDTGSFDYQAWLFEKGIRVTGYVDDAGNNHLIHTNSFHHSLDHLREKLASAIATDLQYRPLNGLVAALAVGVRTNITELQWNVLRGTGTNHLFAIAGLHIGFVSGIIYALVSFFWRRSKQLPIFLATPQAAALGALFAALLYSALAGFSLPTQRAVLMITVFLIACLWRRNLSLWNAWSLALLFILLVNPLIVLSDSFWLSFGTVACIIYGISGRIKKEKWWWHWSRLQWVVAIGVIPFSLLFFHQSSLAGFLANAIAIPWVGLITLPLSLLGNILWFIAPILASWLWLLAEYSLEIIWPLLTHIADLNTVQWITAINNPWILISALGAIILFLAPKGFPARGLCIIWALPLLFWSPSTPKQGEAWFTLLDVGQGLSAVLRTAHHILVFDTGPSFGTTMDAGNAVLVPFLQAYGINNIDVLLISNSNNNHMGGTASLLAQIPVKQVVTTIPNIFKQGFAMVCYAGQHWQWDGVKFQVLYPPLGKNIADDSCVLRIDAGTQSILLTSDIDKKDEQYLLTHENNLLAANIIVAPHYGSSSAFLPTFIQALHPQYTLFSAGYQNHFGYPDPNVVSAYQQLGAKIYSTADNGEIDFKLMGQNGISTPKTYQKHFWDN